MLNQNAKESFDRSKQRAMHHYRPMRLVIFADVFELKAFGQIEIPLNCAKLPQSSDRVFHFEIDLRTIEGRFAFYAVIGNTTSVQAGGQHLFSVLPLLVRTEIQFVPIASLHRKLVLDLLKTKSFEHLIGKIDAIIDLARNLFRRAEEMRVVNGESTHPHQSMQRSGK